jgi:hypothetical protein
LLFFGIKDLYFDAWCHYVLVINNEHSEVVIGGADHVGVFAILFTTACAFIPGAIMSRAQAL